MINLLAQITNPALPAGLQNASNPVSAGNILAKYIAVLWQTAIVLGGLAVIVYLLMGGFYWITASGEKGKIEEAKERIQQSIIGFVVLSSVAAVSVFLSTAFGIDLLKPQFTNLLGGGGGTGGGGGYCAYGEYACDSSTTCVQCIGGKTYQHIDPSNPNCPAPCKK